MEKTLQEINETLKRIADTLEHVSEDIAFHMFDEASKPMKVEDLFKRKYKELS